MRRYTIPAAEARQKIPDLVPPAEVRQLSVDGAHRQHECCTLHWSSHADVPTAMLLLQPHRNQVAQHVSSSHDAVLQMEAPLQVARRSDMDMNGHINNVTYLGWALETVPAHIAESCTLHEVRPSRQELSGSEEQWPLLNTTFH